MIHFPRIQVDETQTAAAGALRTKMIDVGHFYIIYDKQVFGRSPPRTSRSLRPPLGIDSHAR